MCIDATLGVVAVFLSWTPAGFVVKHEEDITLFLRVNFCQPLVHRVELQEALGDEIILNTLVLEVSVHGFDEL